jgi:hypothetical protein
VRTAVGLVAGAVVGAFAASALLSVTALLGKLDAGILAALSLGTLLGLGAAVVIGFAVLGIKIERGDTQ